MNRRLKAPGPEMSGLSDEQLRAELKVFGFNPVITDTTRALMVKKLEKLRKESKAANPTPTATNGTSAKTLVSRVDKSRTVTSFSSDEETEVANKRVKTDVKKKIPITTAKRSPMVVPESPPKLSQRLTATTITPKVNLFSTTSSSGPKTVAGGFGFSDNEGQMEVDGEEEDDEEEEESDGEQETYEVVNRSMNTSFAPSAINSSINPSANRREIKDSRPAESLYQPTTNTAHSRFSAASRWPDTPRPIATSISSRFSTSDYDRHSYSRPSSYSSPKPMFSVLPHDDPYINRTTDFTSRINFTSQSSSVPIKKQAGWGQKFSNSFKWLNKCRLDIYRAVTERLCQLWGAEDKDESDDDGKFERRFSTAYEEKRPTRQSRFKLTEGAIIYLFWGFLALIAVMYVVTVHSDKLHVVHGVAIDSVIFIYENLIFPLLGILMVVGIVLGAYWYQRYRWHRQAEEQRQVYEMVESIINTVRDHHTDRVASGEKDPFLAIVHARDHLIPPSLRKKLGPIWDKAVEYLQQNESRLRQENQCISGEDFMVWRWLQTTAPIRGKGWQGLAFPEEQIPLNMPRFPYTTCLKARGLFDPLKETEVNWPQEVKKAIRAKIGPGVKVLDIRIDSQSNEGCAFIKCATKEDAGEAYKVLHGNWFNGHLVSVKYIKPERFNARFPDSKDY